MAKKDFSTANTAFDALADALQIPGQTEMQLNTGRKTYTDEEAAAFIADGKTSGRKGLNMPRINMAFTPEVYDYIKTMARVRGESMTDFVNTVLRQSLEENGDLYRKAVEFRNSL